VAKFHFTPAVAKEVGLMRCFYEAEVSVLIYGRPMYEPQTKTRLLRKNVHDIALHRHSPEGADAKRLCVCLLYSLQFSLSLDFDSIFLYRILFTISSK